MKLQQMNQEGMAITVNKKQHGYLFPMKAILLSLLLLLSFSAVAFAASSGTCGDNLTWAVKNNVTLTISGTGEMYNFGSWGSDVAPWWGYHESITSVIISQGVTSIGDNAFRSCTKLTSIRIPDSVNKIGFYAFQSCSCLTSISIPENVTHIGSYAFNSCKELQSITVPENVTSIYQYTFRDCISLTDISLPNTLISIGYGAFMECSSLESISIPQSVNSIDRAVFSECTNLESITLPDGITSIPENTFSGCSSLPGITIPASVTSISSSAFEGCSNLTDIVIPAGVTSIGWNAFTNCTSLTNISIPAAVASIGGRAFQGCTNLESFRIPDGITAIEETTFKGCSSLTDITIPESVTAIGQGAFAQCSSLASITIPNSVTTIGIRAFQNCTSLKSVFLKRSAITKIAQETFQGCSGLIEILLPSTVTEIGSAAFEGTSISRFSLNSIVTIGSGAFRNCRSLTYISLTPVISSIADDAFSGSGLSVVDLPESLAVSLTSLPFKDNVTYYADYLPTAPVDEALDAGYTVVAASIDLDCEVQRVDGLYTASVFSHVTFILGYTGSATELTLPEKPENTENYHFIATDYWQSQNATVTSITLPSTLDSVASFSNFTALKDIYLPDTIKLNAANLPKGYTYHAKVGSETAAKLLAANCSFIDTETGRTVKPDSPASDFEYTIDKTYNEVYITGYIGTDSVVVIPATIEGATVKAIRSHAFENNTAITEVSVPDSVDTIYSYAFYNCSNLVSVFLPADMYSIDKYAFAGTALRSIVVPKVTTLHDGVFSDCTSLTEITLPSTLQSIGDTARNTFNNCTALTDVILPNIMGVRVSNLPFVSTVTYHANSGSSTASQLHALKKVFIDRATGELHTDTVLPAVSPTCTETGLTEGAQCVVCGYITTAQQTIPSLGHDWYDAAYTWADDNSTVTAAHVCKNDETHIETETAIVTAEITKPATCEADGETTYSAAFNNTAFEAQSKALADIPATGHDWGDVTYTWAEDNKSVTSSRVCKNDETHTETETAAVTAEVTKPAACEADGETTYFVAFSNAAFEAQSKTLADIPATGHTSVLAPGKLPTSAEPGYTAGNICSVCGKVLAGHLPVESVQSLKLPAALRAIADSAFARCAAGHVLIPDGMTTVGSRTFAYAPNLWFVTVPDSVTDIAPDAFEGCELLTFFCSDSSAAAAYAEAHGFAYTTP